VKRNDVIHSVLSAAFLGCLSFGKAHAAATIFHPNLPESRLEVFSIPSNQAPLEKLGTPLAFVQLHLNEYPTEAVFVILTENRFCATVLLERMRLRLVSRFPNEALYSPAPEQLPLQIERLSLAF
jgi:hypothetical protein